MIAIKTDTTVGRVAVEVAVANDQDGNLMAAVELGRHRLPERTVLMLLDGILLLTVSSAVSFAALSNNEI